MRTERFRKRRARCVLAGMLGGPLSTCKRRAHSVEQSRHPGLERTGSARSPRLPFALLRERSECGEPFLWLSSEQSRIGRRLISWKAKAETRDESRSVHTENEEPTCSHLATIRRSENDVFRLCRQHKQPGTPVSSPSHSAVHANHTATLLPPSRSPAIASPRAPARPHHTPSAPAHATAALLNSSRTLVPLAPSEPVLDPPPSAALRQRLLSHSVRRHPVAVLRGA